VEAIYDLKRVYDVNEIIDIFTSGRGGYGKCATRVPDVVSYELYEWCLPVEHLGLYNKETYFQPSYAISAPN